MESPHNLHWRDGYPDYSYQRGHDYDNEFLHKNYMQRPPPPPGYYSIRYSRLAADDDDNAKVARHQTQVKAELGTAIAALGEAGWNSQYYTGNSYDRPLPGELARAYSKWRQARNDWTRTGETGYLKTMEEAVDFNCPPDASAFPAPIPEKEHHYSLLQRQLLCIGIVWLITMLLLYVLTL